MKNISNKLPIRANHFFCLLLWIGWIGLQGGKLEAQNVDPETQWRIAYPNMVGDHFASLGGSAGIGVLGSKGDLSSLFYSSAAWIPDTSDEVLRGGLLGNLMGRRAALDVSRSAYYDVGFGLTIDRWQIAVFYRNTQLSGIPFRDITSSTRSLASLSTNQLKGSLSRCLLKKDFFKLNVGLGITATNGKINQRSPQNSPVTAWGGNWAGAYELGLLGIIGGESMGLQFGGALSNFQARVFDFSLFDTNSTQDSTFDYFLPSKLILGVGLHGLTKVKKETHLSGKISFQTERFLIPWLLRPEDNLPLILLQHILVSPEGTAGTAIQRIGGELGISLLNQQFKLRAGRVWAARSSLHFQYTTFGIGIAWESFALDVAWIQSRSNPVLDDMLKISLQASID